MFTLFVLLTGYAQASQCPTIPRRIIQCTTLGGSESIGLILRGPVQASLGTKQFLLTWEHPANMHDSIASTARPRLRTWSRSPGSDWRELNPSLVLPRELLGLRAVVLGGALYAVWGMDSLSNGERTRAIYAARLEPGGWAKPTAIFHGPYDRLLWDSPSVSDPVYLRSRVLLAGPMTGGKSTARIVLLVGNKSGHWESQLIRPNGGVIYSSLSADSMRLALTYIGAVSSGGRNRNSVSSVLSTDGGETWTTPTILRLGSPGTPTAYEVRSLNVLGRLHAVWFQESDGGTRWDLVHTRMMNTGDWAAANVVATGTGATPTNLSVLPDGRSGAVLVFAALNDGRYTPSFIEFDGHRWGTPLVLPLDGMITEARVVTSDSTGFVVLAAVASGPLSQSVRSHLQLVHVKSVPK